MVTGPPPRVFVQRLLPRTKTGKYRTKRITHHWAVCDVCRRGTWVLNSRIAKSKTDPIPGLKCRMTPRCPGKHRKATEERS